MGRNMEIKVVLVDAKPWFAICGQPIIYTITYIHIIGHILPITACICHTIINLSSI